jgi:uncharacterized protein (TIGR00725 family)
VTRRHIAVIGPGESDDPAILAAAHAVGTALARAGCVLVCGGLGGVMEAACRGAKQAGGATLGLLPGMDRTAANPYIDIAVPTGLGEARNALVVRAADAVVAIGGGWGTLSEIALAMRTGVPVIALDSWTVSDGAGTAVAGPTTVGDAEEAVRVALAAVPTMPMRADDADEGRQDR